MDTVADWTETVRGNVLMDFSVISALSSVQAPVPETATKRRDPARVSVRPDGMGNSVKSSVQWVALQAHVIETLAYAYLPVYLDCTGHSVTNHV